LFSTVPFWGGGKRGKAYVSLVTVAYKLFVILRGEKRGKKNGILQYFN